MIPRIRLAPLQGSKRRPIAAATVIAAGAVFAVLLECSTFAQDGPIEDIVSREVTVFNVRYTRDSLSVPEDIASREVTVWHTRCGNCTDPIALGLPVNFTLTPAQPIRRFRLRVPLGKRLVIDLTGLDPADVSALYLRWGEAPTVSQFDFSAADPPGASRRIVIESTRDVELFILVEGRGFNGGANDLVLRADILELDLAGLSVRFASQETPSLRAAVRGVGFDASTEFRLVHAANENIVLLGSQRRLIAPSRAEVTFPIAGAPAGPYHLEATEDIGGLRARLLTAFEVRAGNRGAVLDVDFSGFSVYRNASPAALRIRYRNAGDEEMAAPLLKIEARPAEAAELRLATDPDCEQPEGALCQGNSILVLATQADGVPGVLAPGAEGEVAVVYRFRRERCPPGNPCPEVTFTVSILRPPSGAFLHWDRLAPTALPGGMNARDWEEVWRPLSASFGPAWSDFAEGLGRLADRLAPRGVPPPSVRELFRFAVREAHRAPLRPGGAIVGTLLHEETGGRLVDVVVLAALQGKVHSSARTDADGAFAIDWLVPGIVYDLLAVDHSVRLLDGGGTSAIAGDLPAIVLMATPAENDLAPSCLACDESGLPAIPIRPPAEFFTDVAAFTVGVFGAIDPNSKDGTPDPEPPLPPGREVVFKISFENDAESGADAPAREVRIEDAMPAVGNTLGSGLDDRFDVNTLRLLDVSVGSSLRTLGTRGMDQFSGYTSGLDRERTSAAFRLAEHELSGTSRWPVDVDIRFDTAARSLSWHLIADIPDTEPPTEGFLPVEGEGYVSFAVKPRPGLSPGADPANIARITFDDRNNSVTTNTVRYIIGPPVPLAAKFPRPEDGVRDVDLSPTIEWTGSGRDEKFDLHLWIEGMPRPATPIVNDLSVPGFRMATALQAGTRYRWQIVSRNAAGNAESDAWLFETRSGAMQCPDPPSGLGATVHNGGVRLAWETATFPVVAYSVYIWPEEDGLQPTAGSLVAAGIFSNEIDIAVSLKPNTAYRWQVDILAAGCPPGSARAGFATPRGPLLRRADVDQSGIIDITDPILLLSFLFLGGQEPACMTSADTDDSGQLDITDPILILNYLFLGELTPSPPFSRCGEDSTPDGLDCDDFSGC